MGGGYGVGLPLHRSCHPNRRPMLWGRGSLYLISIIPYHRYIVPRHSGKCLPSNEILPWAMMYEVFCVDIDIEMKTRVDWLSKEKSKEQPRLPPHICTLLELTIQVWATLSLSFAPLLFLAASLFSEIPEPESGCLYNLRDEYARHDPWYLFLMDGINIILVMVW